MTTASEPFDFGIRDALLRDPENVAIYLAGCLEDGDMKPFKKALRHVAKARKNRAANINPAAT